MTLNPRFIQFCRAQGIEPGSAPSGSAYNGGFIRWINRAWRAFEREAAAFGVQLSTRRLEDEAFDAWLPSYVDRLLEDQAGTKRAVKTSPDQE